MEPKLIVNQLCESFGSGESSKVELIADTETGKTELVIRKTITERYPITDYEKVMRLYENLNRCGGRRVWSLEDLTK
jgi:hypothetical protein